MIMSEWEKFTPTGYGLNVLVRLSFIIDWPKFEGDQISKQMKLTVFFLMRKTSS